MPKKTPHKKIGDQFSQPDIKILKKISKNKPKFLNKQNIQKYANVGLGLGAAGLASAYAYNQHKNKLKQKDQICMKARQEDAKKFEKKCIDTRRGDAMEFENQLKLQHETYKKKLLKLEQKLQECKARNEERVQNKEQDFNLFEQGLITETPKNETSERKYIPMVNFDDEKDFIGEGFPLNWVDNDDDDVYMDANDGTNTPDKYSDVDTIGFPTDW